MYFTYLVVWGLVVMVLCGRGKVLRCPLTQRQRLSPPLVFDIVTPSANLFIQKSKLPHYPEVLPLRILEKTITCRHQQEFFL